MAENFEKIMDLPFIRGLVADPYGTSDKARKFIRELPDKLDNSQVVEGLNKLGNTNEQIAKGISDIVLSGQRGYQDIGSGLQDFSSSMNSSMGDMAREIESGMSDLSSAMEAAYGSKLPQGKTMLELGQELSFHGKRTLIALAAHGGVSEYQLEKVFHPNFVSYLNQGYSSSQVSSIQSNLLHNMYTLREAQSQLGKKQTLLRQQSKACNESDLDRSNELYGMAEELGSQVDTLNDKARQIQQQLLSHEEIQLLDVACVARGKSLEELVNSGIVRPKSLELLIRSRQVDGNMSAEFARMIVKNKDGLIKPLVQLDGMAGILQETRISRRIGNRGILQREEIKDKLDIIDDSVVDGFDKVVDGISYMSDTLSDGFSTANRKLESIDSSVKDVHASVKRVGEVSYGIALPVEKKLQVLMEDMGTAGKKTFLALYAKGLVNNVDAGVLNSIFTPVFVDNLHAGISSAEAKKLQNQKKTKLGTLQNKLLLPKNQKGPAHQQIQNEISEIEQSMMSQDEMELLDLYRDAQSATDIQDLVHEGFLDDTSLELLVRHQKVDGDSSLDLSRMMRVDENGVMPRFDLDGDVGRHGQLRAQTIQGNIALRQRGIMIKELENIGEYIQETNLGIDYVNSNLESIGNQLDSTNGYLYDILDANYETNALLGESNSLLEKGNVLTVKSNLLLSKSNSLAIQGNALLADSNALAQITNHLLVGLNEQVARTGEQIINVLEHVGGILVSGFGAVIDVLNTIEITGQEILGELYKQSELLSHIDKKLGRPLDTQANECFIYGMEMLGVAKQQPTKEDRSAALESFEKGIQLRNTHLLNLYGAGTALKHLNKDKGAANYLHRAYKIATKADDTLLSKNIAMDLAKIYTKHLKLKEAKTWLDEVIVRDASCIEAFLLKARITNLLGQKEEFEVLLNILYHKIVVGGEQFALSTDYEDVLQYIYKPATDLVDQCIQTGVLTKLLDILPNLQSIGHMEAIKTIVAHVLFHYPQKLLHTGVDVRNLIYTHKDYFLPFYQNYVNQTFVGGTSTHFFALAYLGHGSIDADILDCLIDTGLAYDLDYIALQNSSAAEQRDAHKKNLQDKIYTLGSSAKYMLRDYLKNRQDSPLI